MRGGAFSSTPRRTTKSSGSSRFGWPRSGTWRPISQPSSPATSRTSTPTRCAWMRPSGDSRSSARSRGPMAARSTRFSLGRRSPVVAEGVRQTAETIEAATIEARSGLSDQLESFAANTMDYLRRERALLLDGVGVPEVRTPIAGRHALIVVRGYHYKEDLRTLRPYVKEYRPVLIGVDGGAD